MKLLRISYVLYLTFVTFCVGLNSCSAVPLQPILAPVDSCQLKILENVHTCTVCIHAWRRHSAVMYAVTYAICTCTWLTHSRFFLLTSSLMYVSIYVWCLYSCILECCIWIRYIPSVQSVFVYDVCILAVVNQHSCYSLSSINHNYIRVLYLQHSCMTCASVYDICIICVWLVHSCMISA